MRILDEFNTHHYYVNYELVDLYCPRCGKKSIWEEQGGGDYYLGVTFFCTNCNGNFTFQGMCNSNTQNEIKILKQLKNGITLQPITPPGN